MTNFYEVVENDPGGYYLEVNSGWFSVIRPKDKANLIHNPDFVDYSNNYQGAGGVTLSEGDNGILMPTSCIVNGTNRNITGVRYKGSFDLEEKRTYYFSAYVRSYHGNTVTVKIQLSNDHYELYDVTEEYTRITLATMSKDPLTVTPAIYCEDTIETTGWQFETDELTTYISGNNNKHIWYGAANDSVSYRPITDYTGGEEITLIENGFKVTEIEGLGPTDFAPIIQDIALTDYDIFLASTPEQREISISGQLRASSYRELMEKHGELVNLFVSKNHPVRIIFHPYVCEANTRRVEFDFIYTTGLNETVDRHHLIELSIEGVVNNPCIYGSGGNQFEFVSVDTFDYIFEEDLYHLIYKDGRVEPTIISKYGRAKVTAVASDKNTYAVVNETDISSPYTSTVYRFDPATNTWDLICGIEKGIFEDIEVAENLVIIVGNFYGLDFIAEEGTLATNHLHSCAVYDVEQKKWNTLPESPSDKGFHVKSFRKYSAEGTVRTVVFNKFDRSIHIGGDFNNVNNAYNHANYVAYYIYDETKAYADIIPSPAFGTNDGVNGPIGSVWSIAVDQSNGNVYIGGDFVDDEGPSNPHGFEPSVGNQLPNVFAYFDQARKVYQTTSFPFQAEFGNLGIDRALEVRISRLIVYNGYVFANGTMNMASQAYNNPPSSPGDDFTVRSYLAAVAWFDPNGNNERSLYAKNRGAWLPLGATLPTSTNLLVNNNPNTVAHGLYRTDEEWVGVQPEGDRLDDLDVRDSLLTFSEQDGILMMAAFDLNAYGASNNKQPACGFVEFLASKNATPAGGTFLPPSIYSANPVLRCSGQHFNIDSPEIYGMAANLSVLGFNETLYINSGILVESCGAIAPEDVSIFIERGMKRLSGIVNTTTGKIITFSETDLASTAVYKIYYQDQKINISSGNYVFSPDIKISTGNPLEFVEGENRIKLLFSLPDTLNSEITVRYKPCYISYSELCACENDN